MDYSLENDDVSKGMDSLPSNTNNSQEQSNKGKNKKSVHYEKIGQSEEYDQSLLKRRKKKLQGKGITVALPK